MVNLISLDSVGFVRQNKQFYDIILAVLGNYGHNENN